ncbi:MAG: OmpA family protein [Treponemataceae bacterium]
MKKILRIIIFFALSFILITCKTMDEKEKPSTKLDKNTDQIKTVETGKKNSHQGSENTDTQNENENETSHQEINSEQTIPVAPKKEKDKNIISIDKNTIVIKERSDYRTYINGKYSGLTYRESEIYLQKKSQGGGGFFSGNAFVIQDTRRNLVSQVKKVDEVLNISFVKNADGSENFYEDEGFPLLREFFDSLNLDYQNMAVGTYWDEKIKLSVFPLKERGAVQLSALARFEYAGLSEFLGNEVYKIKAKYALRNNENSNFTAIAGTRDVEIFLSTKNNAVLFVREKTAEQFSYPDGTVVKNEGSLLHFYNYNFATKKITKDTNDKITNFENLNPKTGENTNIDFGKSDNYEVENTELGLKLRLQNLRFVADKDILLSGEESKLDEIATILKQFGEKRFFVEGHTASTGQPQAEKRLSEARALVVVKELVKRGIPENFFLYAGAGAKKPLSSNTTSEGMAKNRRVEITILE